MKNEKNKTVVVGITGRIDSVVAAYLLKKQGFSCIGICIQQLDPHKGGPYAEKMMGQCHVKQIAQVQRICNELEIPFYAVNAHELYSANVIDLVVARRLSGESFSPCVSCSKLKVELLWEKAQKLGASWIATGHYAKIGLNQKTGERYLVSAGAIDEDQSILLSSLESKYLENLLLPLGDMRKAEVEKIAVSLNMGLTSSETNFKQCFEDYNAVAKYIDTHVAKSLRQEGDVINAEDGSILSGHSGIYRYRLGQDKVVGREDSLPVPPNLKVISLNALQKRVYVANIPGIEFDFAFINKFTTTFDIDWSKPISAYAQIYGFKDRIPCLMSMKTNQSVLLEFSGRLYAFLSSGVSVGIYNRPIPGARLLGAGVLGQIGLFQKVDRTNWSDDKMDEKREKIKKLKEISLF